MSSRLNKMTWEHLIYPQAFKRATPFILLQRGAETGVLLSEPGILTRWLVLLLEILVEVYSEVIHRVDLFLTRCSPALAHLVLDCAENEHKAVGDIFGFLFGHRSVLHNFDELGTLQPCPAFIGGETRPLGAVLAGGLAIVVVVSEIEVAVHSKGDKRAVGLKADAVLKNEVILICHRTAGTGAGEVLHLTDCT